MPLGKNENLESLFDLPPLGDEDHDDFEDSDEYESERSDVSVDVNQIQALSTLEKIENSLPAVHGLEASDKEMDDLADTAIKGYKDLMELGMQVDGRSASEILSVASSLMGHAISAKTAKVNKKLKMLELQLKKAKLDMDASKNKDPEAETPSATGKVLDRNELFEMIKNQNLDK